MLHSTRASSNTLDSRVVVGILTVHMKVLGVLPVHKKVDVRGEAGLDEDGLDCAVRHPSC
jgi:hypothetical protein